MLLYFKIHHVSLNWILFTFHTTTARIFILIFIFKVYNFPTEKQTRIFHFQKFGTLESLRHLPTAEHTCNCTAGLRGRRENLQASSHDATSEEEEKITETNHEDSLLGTVSGQRISAMLTAIPMAVLQPYK